MITMPLCRAVLSASTAVILSAGAAAATPAQTVPKHLNLSNKDNRQSFTVHKGDEIIVRLTGQQTVTSTWAWSAPTAANRSVLRRDAATTRPNGEATAVFHAQADGTTTLDSRLRCVPRRPGSACSHVVVPWQVTVKAR
ncbi:hypothetical protein [Streptomyces gibsoniae]|uniref:hypothetical protein n=1 Tax=Streptomyces gibsoniae TaxID=3075529 RepID=UPI00288C09B6|nr:hypothetical protein [Streptomyces sp. DSM 41699]